MARRERRARHSMGRRLIDSVRMRFVPPIEEDANGTFNLRWWQYVEREREMGRRDGDAAGKTTLGPAS